MCSDTSKVRVAAVQFEIGTDITENLATSCRMIDHAAQVRPQILVLPEFCNHLSWYQDREHSYAVAVDLHGEFLQAIGAKARQHGLYLMINCTVRRGHDHVTGTNILFNPQGEQIAVTDKQVLMGNENNFLTPAETCGDVVTLPFVRVGLYSCMDGVIYETPRSLALRGAQCLLNSLNSFALDEASLHVPVRAAENKVFVVGANKVGWLVPPELAAMIAQKVKLSPEQLHGAGESQIVAPDGTVLAIAPHTGEAVIYADIDPAQADDKRRPDTTDIFKSRRPRLYAPIAQPPQPRTPADGMTECIAETWHGDDLNAFTAHLAHTDAHLITLPELAFTAPDAPPAQLTQDGARIVAQIQAALHERETLVALSIASAGDEPDTFAHCAVLVSAQGIILRQQTLHPCGRHPWATLLGDALLTVDTPAGRVALIAGGDTIYPEAYRLAAIQGAQIIASPTHLLETWELQTGLVERSAENRLNLLAASRPTPAGASAIFAVGYDFTLWAEWLTRPFDGNISYPITTTSTHGQTSTRATVYPNASHNRMVSQKTDLVDGRPHKLVSALIIEL